MLHMCAYKMWRFSVLAVTGYCAKNGGLKYNVSLCAQAISMHCVCHTVRKAAAQCCRCCRLLCCGLCNACVTENKRNKLHTLNLMYVILGHSPHGWSDAPRTVLATVAGGVGTTMACADRTPPH